MSRIAIVIGNLNTGGAQSVVCKLAENIDKRENDIFIICCKAKSNTALESRVEKVASVTYLGFSEGFSISDFNIFNRFICRIKPDVIHAHLGGVQYAAVWSILHHRQIVVTAHTTPEKAFTKRTEKLLRYVFKRGLAILVAVSEDNREKCKKYFQLDDNKCRFVNNGVDIHPATPYRRHNPFVFINVAAQDKNKNQMALLRCMEELKTKHPDIMLMLVGNGPEHESLIKYVEEKKDLSSVVVFTGEVNNPEVYYPQADVYVQSSHREAMPMSILEALSFGLPIISTDVGGIKDVVRGNGVLVEDGDLEGYYNAMNTVLTLPENEFKLLRNRSFEIVASYSSTLMAKEYEKIYEQTYSKPINK